MKKLHIVGPRPAYPENWIIFNAPRPILGDEYFDGDFLHGRFYTAVDPNGEFATMNLRENEKLDALVLVYYTMDQAKEEIHKKYPQYAARIESLGERKILETFDSIMNQ